MWGITKAWDVVDVQCCSQRFIGRRERPPTSFTLFSNKLQVQIMWSDTHDKWHDVSQTVKHSVAFVHFSKPPIKLCRSSFSFTALHSHPGYIITSANKGGGDLQSFCLIFISITGVYACVIVLQIWIWVHLFIHFIFVMQHITLLFTSLKSYPWLDPRWVKDKKVFCSKML